MRSAVVAAVLALSFAGAAQAEVVDRGPNGFRLKHQAQVAAPPEKVFKALAEIGRWWSDAHTYSGKAANLSMPLTANACYCETLPSGGGVRHGVVELVIPNRQLRVNAALGPLQDEGVSAAWTFYLKPQDGGAELLMTYHVGGARDFVVTLAPKVDEVMGEAFRRLTTYAETGKPE
jgi:uncharacterized protein YndB with AHSA1/START domain